MRFAQLEVFVTIYKHNSITRASEDLIVTQPAVSIQLRTLEQDLGVKLFERVGRNLRPTPAGEMLYKYASSIINLKNEAKTDLEHFRLGLSGQVVLGLATGIVYCIPSLLDSYQNSLSNVKLVLKTDIADRIREETVEDELDFGLIWGPVADSRLETRQLSQHEFVILVPNNHPLAQAEEVSAEELGQYPMVLPVSGTSTRHYVEGILRSLGIKPKIAVELPTTDGMKWAVSAGLGVTLISLPAARYEIAAGVLKPLRIKGKRLLRPISLIYNKQPNNTAVMSRFMDYIVNHSYWKTNQTIDMLAND
ncbi:LysR family transcriptional regulator [Tepidibacillus sp. HK-1]|uniref:LysR family transcriptional regulator n=1 Tax=Tepidibacillus sp. HK-1 TaxID=1883407 RepID=UPI000853D13D|nr:LysR family transcriptional regulator [Tepidibacillus sp. HK-1]GBF12244.1 HTH-type transcriptional activator CmpR [Tepidibacillus sp. HK-1]